MKLWPCNIIPPKTKKDWSKLRSLAHLLTQRVCLGIGVLHLGRCVPFGHQQCRTEGDVHGQSVLGPLRGLWQGLEQPDPSGEVADGFQMGRALAGLLACPLPVDNRLLGATRRRVVLGDQLRLGLHERGEPGFEDLSNLLMDVLPGTLEQRRIGRVLDQGVPKDIPGARQPPPLVEEFSPHQLRQPCL